MTLNIKCSKSFLVYILCPKISILYPFIDTSAYKLNHLDILYNVLERLYLSNSDHMGIFILALEITSMLTSI